MSHCSEDENLPWLGVSAESVGGFLLGCHAVVLLPGVFTSVDVSAEFLGLSGVVTFTPVSKVELLELDLPWFWVLAIRVVGSVFSGGAVRNFP